MLATQLFGPIKQWGFLVKDLEKAMLDQRYVYMGHPMMGDVVIELMEVDDGFVADYERSAQQAAIWDGSDPYRLISL